MRDKTLGRWILRLAVTIGAGAVVLGVGTVAANAGTSMSGRAAVLSTTITVTHQADAPAPAGEPMYVTEDWSWE
ncbi:hypothetical protein ACPPVO_57295 [Dactylosporangium sp. McL0621]|uniref:hypothetical protein n=1 Tax=Dactylosporangium sp. McL0621 TaxID=3415678 RepID=UPI003CFA3D6F